MICLPGAPSCRAGLYLAPPILSHGSTLKSGFQENWRFLNGILTKHSQMYPPRPGRTAKPPGGRLWRDLIIAHSTSAPTPTLAPYQRQRRKRYKQSLEPTTLPTALYSRICATEFVRSIARQGSLDRRSVVFFGNFLLTTKKVTRRRGGETSFYAQKRRQRFHQINCNRIMNGFGAYFGPNSLHNDFQF